MSPRVATSTLSWCKAYYFCNSFGLACLLPFLPLFYASWGLSKSRVGWMGATRHCVGAVLTPCWNALADATKAHNAVHFACIVAQALAYFALARANHAWPGIWWRVVLAESAACCVGSLGDNATCLMVKRWNLERGVGEDDAGGASYGKQRLWGAVSWGLVAAPTMGVIMSVGGPRARARAPFSGWLIFLLVSAMISTRLRHDPVVSENADAAKNEHEMGEVAADEVGGTKMSRRIASANDLHASQDSIAVRLWRVVRDPAVALRFFLFLMSGASMTITDLYLFLWLEDLGGTPATMGAALFCTCVCEVAVFYNGAKIKKALTLDWCLALVPFCYFIRQFYYWLLPAFGNPWAVLPVQFLHGVTFGLYWSTANDFIQDISPFGLSASMTGLFSAVNSAGGFSGAVLGGMAYDAFGGGGLFLGVGLINLCLGVFFTALKLRSDRANAVAYVLLESESTEEANAL